MDLLKAIPLVLAASLTSGCGRGDAAHLAARGIASIDLCADQMVLGLVERGRIIGVSTEAASDAGYAAPLSRTLPRLRPVLEDIVARRPAVVVRSYGGSVGLDRQLERSGIRVVQLGYPSTLAQVRSEVLRVGTALDAEAAARRQVADFDRRLAAARAAQGGSPRRALYMTPGNVTTGPGSLIAAIMAAGGYRSYRTAPGWGSLPLEELVRRPPDLIVRGFFDSPASRQDHWSAAMHPAMRRSFGQAAVVEVPGAELACGNWLAAHAVSRIAAAQTGSVTP